MLVHPLDAGTGKTEAVKDVDVPSAYVIVTNCTDLVTYASMGKILRAFVCLVCEAVSVNSTASSFGIVNGGTTSFSNS